MVENSGSRQARKNLFENFESLAIQARSIEAHSGDVSPRARQTGYQSRANRIARYGENYGDRSPGVFECFCRFRSRAHDDVTIHVRKISCKRGSPPRIAFGKAPLDGNVFTFYIAEIA